MCAAIEAVKNGTSIYRAAVEHGVPRMTLQDRYLAELCMVSNQGQNHFIFTRGKGRSRVFSADS